jgi:hypothetical protein
VLLLPQAASPTTNASAEARLTLFIWIDPPWSAVGWCKITAARSGRRPGTFL